MPGLGIAGLRVDERFGLKGVPKVGDGMTRWEEVNGHPEVADDPDLALDAREKERMHVLPDTAVEVEENGLGAHRGSDELPLREGAIDDVRGLIGLTGLGDEEPRVSCARISRRALALLKGEDLQEGVPPDCGKRAEAGHGLVLL
jgi:hypothetical protein